MQQLRAHHSWERIRGWVGSGELIDLGHSWLQIPAAGTDISARFARAQAQLREPVALCAQSATEYYGFAVVADPLLHVCTLSGRSISSPEGVLVHQAPPRLPVFESTGMRVVDRAEAAIDTARMARSLDVLAVLDAAVAAGISADDLTIALTLAGRRRGVVQVRRWIDDVAIGSESPMESRTRARVIEYGLPTPSLQVAILTASGQRFADLGWQQYRVGLDYEGEEFHAGDGKMAKDRRRHNDITDTGWTMFYPTAVDVYRDYRRLCARAERALRAAGWGGVLTPRQSPR